MPPAAVSLLTNFVPPYLVSLFRALDERVERLRILVSTAMEEDRHWGFQGGGLPVRVQRTLTLRQTWRHPHGFSEPRSLHIPLDTLPALFSSRPEVIVTTEFGARTLQCLAYRLLRPRTRIVLWALVTEVNELGRGWARERLRRWILRRVDAVIVSGSSGARYVARLGAPAAAIFQVPPYAAPGKADAVPRVRTARGPRRMLYVGRVVEGKGLEPFLAALSRWSERHPEERAELCVVGDGPARRDLESLPVSSQVALRFTGNLPYEALPEVYARAEILVFPTLADEWGVVVNEALAAGVPVLGSVYSQAVEDLIREGETGWTFRTDRPEELDAALTRALAASGEDLERMGARCRDQARRFAPEQAVERMLEAIDFARRGDARGPVPCPLCGALAAAEHRLPHASTWRCGSQACQLRFAAPQPDDATLRSAYEGIYYPTPEAAATAVCEGTPPEIAEELLAALRDRLGRSHPWRLLDFGCGRGALSRAAMEQGFRATGIEPDPEARAACAEAGVDVFESLAALHASEPRARFDAVVLWQVVEHLRRPWDELARLRRLMAPGALLAVATPNASCLKAVLAGARWENRTNPTHLYYFDEVSLRRALEEAGIAVAERLRVPEHYPHHGFLRRRLRSLLCRRGLDGDVVLLARADDRPPQPGVAVGAAG